MTKIKITLPDGSIKEYAKGITAGEIAFDIGRRLGQDAVLAKINGNIKDLSIQIKEDSALQIITIQDKEGLDGFRHSLAHLLAAAVMELWPDTKRTIGPPIENGFYYDFEFSNPISEDDLPKIEKKMREILPKWDKFERSEATAAEAKKEYPNNQFKHELIDEFSKDGKKLTFYKSGNYSDLCRGGHVSSMKSVQPDSFKLTHLAGAYWRGSEKNPQLTRIYAVAFPTKKELDAYLKMVEEAKKRDHKKLGRELDLYTTSELVGKGLPIWLPKGETIKREIENFAIETEKKAGYQRVSTPVLAKKELFIKSGHIPYFQESMFPEMVLDDGAYYLKAMNCPYHHLIFNHKTRSYRDLPLRISEYGLCHRFELSGTLSGLLRVRMLSMNDAHIYCKKDQIEKEFGDVIKMIVDYYKTFGFENYYFRLSLWDPNNREKYINEPENWESTQEIIRGVLKKNNVKFEEVMGEAAFYGPKVDIQFKTVTGREESMSTIQLDFIAKKKFGLKYADKDNKENNEVYVIHRAPLSTHERFIAFLIEEYAGKFPLWLSPVQIRILSVSDKFEKYARKINEEFLKNNLRSEVDSRTESISYKVREAQAQKIPLILTVGEKEEKNGTVAVRTIDNKIHFGVKLDDFLGKVMKNIEEKKIKVEL
ncbi:threonine--tRNA ligase [Candidatus Woesearchaeota archaeon]|jgi:threonyl-tRNA synthetase|nr:threonine--tRNA ligase [Candidatus Woesearchaeota archaeon]|tara:strand:- start:11909 stop:13861 length:1953 start_codon:yes stop_codon:yes gene_type:complete